VAQGGWFYDQKGKNMSSVIISGDTSGAITVSAPAVAGTNTLTLQAATATNSVNTLGTAVASTSGTSIDFTSLPSWIKRITVMFSGVSTNGTSPIIIQLGDSGGIETSGYTSASFNDTGSSSSTPSTGFAANPASVAAANLNGAMTITSMGSNIFSQTGTFYRNNTNGMAYCAGTKTLSDVLTQIRITTVNGTDTFDAGSVNILYEG
jgi:hypothetical protein